MATVFMVSVISEPKPQSGQTHRSSGDFSTDIMPDNTVAWKWVVKNHPNPDAIRFNVKQDVVGHDPTWFKDVYNGMQINTNIKKERKLYIADPSHAGESNFTVEVYAVTS